MTSGLWLEPGAVALRLGADSKRQALHLLAGMAGRVLGRPAQAVFDALMAREAEGSTGVGDGVALPHARLAGLEAPRTVFVRLETPVDFQSVDGKPVDLLFALFAPMDAPSEHLRMLARMARALRKPELREQLRKAQTADAACAHLSGEAPDRAA